MTDGLSAPVVLILFNRPDRVAESFAAVRTARPRRLFVVADGPRPHHPDDAELCRRARHLATEVDWPCEVTEDFATDNLGCDDRVVLGLDRVFDQVERAIVIEDDVVPTQSFFTFADRALDRFADRSDVVHVSGRNELGRWSPDGAPFLSRRVGVWGWATWADRWTQGRRVLAEATIDDVETGLGGLAGDELLRRHLTHLFERRAEHGLVAWDIGWTLACTLLDGLAVVPPVNLVTNNGFGTGANRTLAHDFRADLPSTELAAAVATCTAPIEHDPVYDRLSLLVELAATYQDPATVRRLARLRAFRDDVRSDVAFGEHFAPMDHPVDTMRGLASVRGAGTRSSQLDEILAVLRREADR